MSRETLDLAPLAEDRTVPGVVLRHRAATIERAEAATPTYTLGRGAVWVRGDGSGAGVLVTHGASTVLVRDGAAVIESMDFEALVLVVAGEVAVKGAGTLPRSVLAGQAVALSLDGSFGSPEPLAPAELAADRFITENLARDALASRPPEAAAPPAPAPTDPAAAPSTPPTVGDSPAGRAPDPVARPEAAPPVAAGIATGAVAAARVDSPPPRLPEPAPDPAPVVAASAPAPALPMPPPSEPAGGGGSLPIVREPGSGEIVVRDPFAPDETLTAGPAVGTAGRVADRSGSGAPPESEPDAKVIQAADVPPAPAEEETSEQPAPTRRRTLLIVVIALALVASVVGALLLTQDEEASTPTASTTTAAVVGPSASVAPIPSTTAPLDPVGELEGCEGSGGTFVATGTVSGGGQSVARYTVVIGLVDPSGEIYAEKAQRVVPSEDRAEPASWEATLEVAPDEVRPGTECRLVRIETTRI